jgi:hypothetical protein
LTESTASTTVVWILIGLYVVWRLWRAAAERSIASDFAKLGMRLQRAPGMITSLLTPVPFHIRRRYVLWQPDGQTPALDWVTWPAVLMAHKAAGEASGDAEARAKPWEVRGEGSEGFYVVGISGWSSDPVLRRMPDLFGPYATREDAEAVVTAKDPSVRPLAMDLEGEGGDQDIAEPETFHPINRTPEGFVVLDDGDVVAGPFADYLDALAAVKKLEGRPMPWEQTPSSPS